MSEPSYKRWSKAEVVEFGTDFREAVQRAREILGIPKDGFSAHGEANEWAKEHCRHFQKKQHVSEAPWYWHFPKEFVELLESFAYSAKPARAGYHPEIPLHRLAMELVHKFDLPEQMVLGVIPRILMERSGMGLPSTLQLVACPIDEGSDGIKYVAMVAGIDENTTKEDWLHVWRQMQHIQLMQGREKPPSRRPIESLLLRDLTWWDWTRMKKMKAKEVAEKWSREHPDRPTIGEDVVRKAVGKIDKLMKAKSRFPSNRSHVTGSSVLQDAKSS